MPPLATWVTDSTYLNVVPYLTLAEFRAAATGLDLTSLKPGGGQAAQDAELANVIMRASSWIDKICNQVIAATSSTEDGWARVKPGGAVVFPTRYFPVLELTSALVGSSPSTASPLATGAGVRIGRTTIEIPAAPAAFAPGAPCRSFGTGQKVYVVATYVCGYPNTLLGAACAAGDSAIAVKDAAGVYGGTRLTVYDGQSTEAVAVQSVSGGVLALAAPLRSSHDPAAVAGGISVSALPGAVKQAAIFIASALIKSPGDAAIVLEEMSSGGPRRMQGSDADSGMDLLMADELLSDFRRGGF